MQGWNAMTPIPRTAKAAREIPTDPADPLGTSTTIVSFGGWDSLWTPGPAALDGGEAEVLISIFHEGVLGGPNIYLVWGRFPLPPAVGAVMPTLYVEPQKKVQWEMGAINGPFHLVVESPAADQPCRIDRFVRFVASR